MSKMEISTGPAPGSSASSSTATASSSSHDTADLVCSICSDGQYEDADENPLVVCNSCGVCVHRDCYEAPLTNMTSHDSWICEQCKWGAKDATCALCPTKNAGPMKRTTDWKWAHLTCALWIPETFFRLPDGREPIDYLQIPRHRWNKPCMHCHSCEGATMQCSQQGCTHTFHITCGLAHNIFLEYKSNKTTADVIVAICATHAAKWHRLQSKGSSKNKNR